MENVGCRNGNPGRADLGNDNRNYGSYPFDMNEIPCRLCGSSSTKNLGRIPDCGEFAGQATAPSINGGYLMHCLNCDSLFRSPILSQAEYMTLYQNASDTLWKSYRGTRNDFVIIHDLLSGLPGGKILDIGCHSGLFLEGLSEKFDKYGIEPSDTASRAALSRGVRILGKTLTQINPDQRFDVVVAIDVIEHVTDVTEFLCNTLRHVKEEGLLIISTGNPDCTLWKKIFKARFWYNSLSEHLTFPSIAYFTLYCEQAGLARPLQICFCYLKCSLGWKFVLCASQIIFFISPLMYRFFEYRLRKTIGMPDRVTHDRGLAAGGSFKDHQLIVIKK